MEIGKSKLSPDLLQYAMSHGNGEVFFITLRMAIASKTHACSQL